MRHVAPVLLLVAPLLAGCFTYAPLEPARLAPDMSVRVRLTEDASRRMEATRDPDTPIEGRVFEVDAGQMRLLPEVGTRGSTAPLTFAFDDLSVVELRQISQSKTWLMVGAGMAGGVLLLLSIDGLPFGSSGGGDPGDFLLAPGLRIPIGP